MKYTIEQYDEMPFREKIRDKYKWWGYRDHNIKGINFYKIKQRVLQNNIGKSFNMAFHYFCTLVPKYLQHEFIEEFENPYKYRWRSCDYYINEQGLIQEWKKEQTKKIVKVQVKPNVYLKKNKYRPWEHKSLWIKISEYPKTHDNTIPESFGRWDNKEDYILLEDNAIYFTSKNDYRFKRHFAEQVTKANKAKKKKKPSIEDFRHILRAKKLKDKEKTRQKLEANPLPSNSFSFTNQLTR